MQTNPSVGSATREEVAHAPDVDVWAWSGEKNPSLEGLAKIKTSVHINSALRRQLESHLQDLVGADGEPANPEVAGMAFWLLAKHDRAYDLLNQVKSKSPAITFALAQCCLMGQVSADGRRPMRRPDLAAALLEEHPDLKKDARVFRLYLDALAFDHDLDGVEKAMAGASPSFAESPDGTFYVGRIAEWKGDYLTAVEAYERVLAEDPHHRGALLRLAFRSDLSGDEELAEELYKRLIMLQPPDAHSLLNYGVFLEDKNRFPEAVRIYRQVLDKYPRHRRATQYLRDARSSLDMIFDEDSERRHDKRNRLLRIPINDFELSVRARNCLAKMKIEVLGDLVQKTEAELLAYKNFGETSLNEIKSLLESKGLRLGMNLDEDPIPIHPVQKPDKPKTPVELPPGVDATVLKIVLADLELSVRVRKALAQVSAVTVGDLLAHTEVELLAMKNFGQTSLNELKARLSEHGVSIRPS